MSIGLRSSKAPLLAMAPSITISASLPPEIERKPRSIILELGLTPLLWMFICIPATLPARAEVALVKLFEETDSPPIRSV